jgi:hypothetical protein
VRTARRGTLVASLAAGLLAAAGAAGAQPPPSPSPSPSPRQNRVTEIGQRFQIEPRVVDLACERPAPVAAKCVVSLPHGAQQPARYLRAHLEVEDGLDGAWYLTVRDAQHRAIEVLTPADFRPSARRWTGRIPGNVVRFDLRPRDASAATARVRLVVGEYIAMPASAARAYYSLQVDNQPSYRALFPEEGQVAEPDSALRVLGDSVAFVMGSRGRESWCCSGVVVAEDLLLTNWHCGGPPQGPPELQWNADICKDLLLDLSWDGDALSREFGCREVVARDRERDYALLRIAPLATGGRARPAPLRQTAPAGNEPLTVIHHPVCLPKRISDGCFVGRSAYKAWVGPLADVDFTHKCDTESGSSGSAVLDAQGRVVGLHHKGFADSDDAEAKQGRFNTAVRVDQILDHLRATRPEVVRELLLAP